MSDLIIENPITKQRRIFWKIDEPLAAILLHCGLATPYAKPAETAPTSPWGVSKGRFDDHPFIFFRQGATESFFDGPPERAADFKPRDASPPDHILAAYAELLKQNGGNVSVGQDVAALAAATRAKEPARPMPDWK